MPAFSHNVPADPRGPSFPIVRTPPGRPLTAIVTSPDLVGCFTHYHKGRTVPCEQENCEACHDGLPFRWHAYQSVHVAATGLHCLFECTAQAAEHFTDYREAHATIRGCQFEARRYNSKPNARILIRTRPADLTGLYLPKPPDLVKCLGILWGFAADDVVADRLNPEKKTVRVTHRKKGD